MGALLLQGRLIATGLWRRPPPPSGPRVALFVHGFLAAGPVFDPMRQQVEALHRLPTLDFTYGPMASFTRTAERLAAFVDAHVPPGVRLSLVGHSLGGLLARWYVQEMGGHARVDRLVTLATPHAGTERVRMLPLPLARGVQPGGSVVRRLEQRAHLLAPIAHTVVAAGNDRMVQPAESATFVRPGKVVWLPDVGHNELLYDPRTQRIVCEALGDRVGPPE